MNSLSLTYALATTAGMLAVVMVWLAPWPQFLRFGASSAIDTTVGASSPADSVRPTASGEAVGPFPPGIPFDWSLVETNDFKRYILNLRRIQCPESTIRDIVIADINKMYAPREAPLKQSRLPVITGIGREASTAVRRQDYERRKRLREVEREKAALVKDMLGIDLPLPSLKSWHSRGYERYETASNALPPAKREQVREIQEAYWMAADELKDRYNSVQTPQYLEDYKKINQQRLEMMGRILEGRELEDYEIRSSDLAARLGAELQGFRPTEEEFRSLYKLHHEIEGPYGGTMQASPLENVDSLLSPAEKERELQDSLLHELGPERFQAYQKARDPKWQMIEKIDQRFQLGPEKSDEAYQLTREASELADKVNSGLSEEEVAIQGEVLEQKLRALLGDKAYSVFEVRSEEVFLRPSRTKAARKTP